MNAATSLKNYEYLDILDRGCRAARMQRTCGGVLYDIGCASFWYAATLQAFFSPDRMVGVEVEGHRLFRDGRTRIDYAAGYMRQLPNARFMVADYSSHEEPADIITAWFPFVTPAAILAWRLPLTLLEPARLFERVRHNLRPQGLFLMVNHGLDEARLAAVLCDAAGLRRAAEWSSAGAFGGYREHPPVVSWRRHG